ncbi:MULTISPECIES: hypothetical protein [Chryseobacterium]|nr:MULTISPECIES: hypothetical protein [Chryseobacterium]
MKQNFVYILRCSNNSYYTGVAHDIEAILYNINQVNFLKMIPIKEDRFN